MNGRVGSPLRVIGDALTPPRAPKNTCRFSSLAELDWLGGAPAVVSVKLDEEGILGLGVDVVVKEPDVGILEADVLGVDKLDSKVPDVGVLDVGLLCDGKLDVKGVDSV